MKIKVKKPIKGTTETEYPDKTKSIEEDVIGVSELTEESQAKVGTKMGATVNVGNYESVRIDTWVEVECAQDEMEEAQAICFEWCDEKLSEGLEKVREAFGVKE